jgi:hypothetical protein
MGNRVRKLVATVAIIVLVVLYGLLAMEIGARVATMTGTVGQFVYFILAGLLWVLPAGLLVSWGWRKR